VLLGLRLLGPIWLKEEGGEEGCWARGRNKLTRLAILGLQAKPSRWWPVEGDKRGTKLGENLGSGWMPRLELLLGKKRHWLIQMVTLKTHSARIWFEMQFWRHLPF